MTQLDIGIIGQTLVVISFAAGTIKYLIVNPLQAALMTLKESIDKLEMMLERLEADHKNLDRRVTVVEESAKAAHKRIDCLEAK